MEKRKRTPAELIIRKGDEVEVIDPRFVKRVGYPKCMADYREELVRDHGPLLDQLCRAVFGKPRLGRREDIEKAIAYAMAGHFRFGGPERTIHWEEHPELMGHRLKVRGVRTAYTGRYYAPSSSTDYWTGERDYEPGGLENAKAHRIAQVVQMDGKWRARDERLEIPVYHLNKVVKP